MVQTLKAASESTLDGIVLASVAGVVVAFTVWYLTRRWAARGRVRRGLSRSCVIAVGFCTYFLLASAMGAHDIGSVSLLVGIVAGISLPCGFLWAYLDS